MPHTSGLISIAPPASGIHARINLPASKSVSARALILHALTPASPRPGNLSACDDTDVLVKALSHTGAPLIDVGAAGTAMRFLTAYLSASSVQTVLTGSERMKQRPIGVLVDALRQIGAHIDYAGNEGFPPLRIAGARLGGGHVSLPGDVSSQYVSALLLIAPTLEQGLRLTLTGGIASRPYINLTLHLMAAWGAKAAWKSERDIEVLPGGYVGTDLTVENDWSAASYWYEVLALGACGDAVTLPGLFKDSPQGDSQVARLFAPLGVETTFTASGIRIERHPCTAPPFMEKDFIDTPDLVQTMAVTCCMAGVPFAFSGVQSLRIKETDRLEALIAELRKMGFVLRTRDGGAAGCTLIWDGDRTERQEQAVIETYQDHRMAMSFAPACRQAGSVTIAQPQVVSKSYPGYWDDLQQAGFTISPVNR